MPFNSAREKFVHELADLDDTEHQFLEVQHEMHSQPTKGSIMIADHIAESEHQVKNPERIFGRLGEEPKRRACDKAKGIVSEGRQAMQAATTTSIRDSLTTRATKAKHYELVSYADLIGGAQLLDLWEPLKLLKQNREQEARTAPRLERRCARLLMQVPV